MVKKHYVPNSYGATNETTDLLNPMDDKELNSVNGKRQQVPIFSANYGKDNPNGEVNTKQIAKVLALSLKHILRGA